jgi:hypothetical protein
MATIQSSAFTEVFYVLDTGEHVCSLIEEGHHYTNKEQALQAARVKNCGVLQLTRRPVPASTGKCAGRLAPCVREQAQS